MPRACGSCEAISEQELQRTVEADVRQRRRAALARFGPRRAEAQEAVIGLARLRQPGEVLEQRGRIIRQVARERSDLRLAVELLGAEPFARERRSGDGRQLVA